MIKNKIKTNTKKLSRWTATLLIVLLATYYAITVINTNKMIEQVNMIHDHPYPVSIAAGKVSTGIVQLRSLPERLMYARTPDVIETVRCHYEDIDKSLTSCLDFIVRQYTYSTDEAIDLQQSYFELRDLQNKLLELCYDETFTDEKTMDFFAENLEPRLDELMVLTAGIISGATTKFDEFGQHAFNSRLSTIIFATVLTLAVFIALCIYLFILKCKSEQEEDMRHVLKEALDSAQSANEAKSMFLSNMSHDIRTPMNAIIGMTAIAGMSIDDTAKVRDCLSKISVSSKHLLGLINDVLDMSKIESGKIALNNEEFVLSEFVHTFISIIQSQAKSKHLELDISVNNLKHERIVGDTLRINQILLNIMGNAVKFTPAGGKVSLKICELNPKHSGYGTYQFIISDNGIGMPKDFLEKIFLPFERVQTSTNSKIEGTGLGMAITKSIVDMMNGQISVESSLGAGTTFKVTIHLKLQKTESEYIDYNVFSELRSLVVDDDRDVCEDTSRMLNEIGIKSEWVLTGAEAVDKSALAHENNKDYHSVIIDWKMPGMDGLETTRRIRSIVGNDTPIIILTAYDWTDIEEEAKDAGVNAFLAKPLFKSKLYHIMHDIVLGVHNVVVKEPVSDNVSLNGRVLLVEDNAMNMEIASELIQSCGCLTENAWDGDEAVHKLENSPDGYYNLIFMDVQMPHMDGYEATRQIRRLEDIHGLLHTPIVAMSANAFVEDIDKAYSSGMDDYITKPVGIDELRNILKKYLDGSIKTFSELTN